MRFALIDNERAEAKPGLIGLCPGCLEPVVAKCGTQRIHHWAHRSKEACNTWREPETEWHRKWKNYFPDAWQEVFLPDERTGEKHVADVRTRHGLVIEFQHSHIHPIERKAREGFHQNMIWVVDCARLKRDYPRFLRGKGLINPIRGGLFRVDCAEDCFSSEWLESTVPVIFDFLGMEDQNTADKLKQNLYCLFPERIGPSRVLAILSRRDFVNSAISGKYLLWARGMRNLLIQISNEWHDQEKRRRQLQASIAFDRFSRGIRGRHRGRHF